MKKLLLAGIMLASAPFIVSAQTSATGTVTTGTTTASATVVAPVDPGLAPGDFFYFLDRWGEELNTFFTFNKEKKAQLHLEYAKERVAEMKKVLEKPDAKLDDVKSAKENFDAQVADAAAIVKSEKDSGADVANLARELDDELDQSRTELKDVLQGHQDNQGRAEAEIRAKIAALTASSTATSTNSNELQGLTQALESITKEKNNANNEEENIDADLSDEQAIFEQVMGPQMAAEKHLEQATRLRDQLEQVAGQVSQQVSEQLMKQAEEAMKRGDFEAAKRISKDAERGLENAKMMREGINMGVPNASGTEMNMEDSVDIGTGESADSGLGSNLDNLDQGIKEGERMMENVGR